MRVFALIVGMLVLSLSPLAAQSNASNSELANGFWLSWGVTSRTNADWVALAARIRDLSAAQHNGVPQFNKRTCHARAGACVTSITFFFKDGKPGLLREAENALGKTIARDMCSFSSTLDVRFCIDFDTNHAGTEMLDSDGEWRQVQ